MRCVGHVGTVSKNAAAFIRIFTQSRIMFNEVEAGLSSLLLIMRKMRQNSEKGSGVNNFFLLA